MKLKFFGYTIFNFYAVSSFTPKNWLVSWWLIQQYGASDLKFQSRKEFLIFAKFFKKWCKWCFAIEILREVEPYFPSEGREFYLFTGAKSRMLLEQHEAER